MHQGEPPFPRAGHSAALLGHRVYIVGGGDGCRAVTETQCLHVASIADGAPRIMRNVVQRRSQSATEASLDNAAITGTSSFLQSLDLEKNVENCLMMHDAMRKLYSPEARHYDVQAKMMDAPEQGFA